MAQYNPAKKSAQVNEAQKSQQNKAQIINKGPARRPKAGLKKPLKKRSSKAQRKWANMHQTAQKKSQRNQQITAQKAQIEYLKLAQESPVNPSSKGPKKAQRKHLK